MPEQQPEKLVEAGWKSLRKELDLVHSLHIIHGPMWRGKDGTYVPVKLMESRHLANSYKMMLKRFAEAIMALAAIDGPPTTVGEEITKFAEYCAEWMDCLGEELDHRGVSTPIAPDPESYPTFRVVDILPSGEPWRIEVL